MEDSFLCRPEAPADFAAIDALVGDAFAGAHYSDGTEVEWLSLVRESEHYLPKLSFVLTDGDRIVGHILASRCMYPTLSGEKTAVVIAPLAISPLLQGRGLGGTLLLHTLNAAASQGYELAFLEGFYAYYSRYGFRPAIEYGLQAQNPTPGGNELLLRSTTDRLPDDILPGIINIYNE